MMRPRRRAAVEVVVAPNVARGVGPVDDLPHEDRSRASALTDPLDRERFYAGRQLLRAVLAERIGRGPRELRIGSGVHGRPFLLDDGPSVAVACGRDWCAVALSDDCAVGVALGERGQEPSMPLIAGRLPESARRDVLAAPPEQRATVAVRCWATLEAAVVACGATLDRAAECLPLVAGEVRQPAEDVIVAVAGRTARTLEARWSVRGGATSLPVPAA